MINGLNLVPLEVRGNVRYISSSLPIATPVTSSSYPEGHVGDSNSSISRAYPITNPSRTQIIADCRVPNRHTIRPSVFRSSMPLQSKVWPYVKPILCYLPGVSIMIAGACLLPSPVGIGLMLLGWSIVGVAFRCRSR